MEPYRLVTFGVLFAIVLAVNLGKKLCSSFSVVFRPLLYRSITRMTQVCRNIFFPRMDNLRFSKPIVELLESNFTVDSLSINS